MHIAFDYTLAITSGRGTGIGRYTRELVAALMRLNTSDRITLFSNERPNADCDFPAAPNLRTRVLPIGTRSATILWQRARVPLPLEVFTGRADVLHGPNYTLPPSVGMKRIVTVHDLSFLIHPECAVPSLATYLSKAVPRAVKSADRVIADSQRTADDLVERLGTPREKIAVIHLGVDAAFSPVSDPKRLAALDARLELQHPLVLTVGTIEPRKNYPALIAAFARVRSQPGGPRMLAISGRKGWLYDETFTAIEKYGVADAVRFLDYIPDDELPTLYSTADVFAMPSRYEGFGLPVIEAMACGTPVVCSDGGSLPEAAGDAALLVPVGDEEALADGLVRALTDAELRETLERRGLQRVATFTWERAAQQVLGVYEEVVKR
jgi:glycosyltransferase involved in cell wall biosynthesis